MSASNTFPRPLKRKLNDPTTSFSKSSSKKASKHNEHDSPRALNGHSNGFQSATVQDEPEETGEDREAGPELPPEDEDEEDEPADDEDGRFFGGGISNEERNVMDFIEDNEDAQAEEEINLAWLKKTALNFERKINKNAELRAKFEDDPMKFVSSEADLDSEIKSLSLLSEHTDLYQDFVRSGCCDSLISLMAHDNTDIAIAACEVVAELIDEDTGASSEEWTVIVKSMLKAEVVDLLISNLRRLNESGETDSAGVYHVLNILENLLSDSSNAEKIGAYTKLLEWLLQRVKQEDETAANKVGQNRQYAAEILVILAQNHDGNAVQLIKLSATDTLLQLLSTWRKRDPEKESDEEEFAENLFDCLVALCNTADGCSAFIEDEGVELCLIMLKEGRFSKGGALRLLDHASSSPEGRRLCEKIVDSRGLKTLFTLFMKGKKLERTSTEHLLNILASMLRLLSPDTPARIRTLAKFVEKDYEKCNRLLETRKDYLTRLAAVQTDIEQQRQSMSSAEIVAVDDDWLLKRIDAGLFTLQTINIIVAWLVAEDEGARTHFTTSSHGLLEGVKASLKEQSESLDIETGIEAQETREMLEALLQAV